MKFELSLALLAAAGSATAAPGTSTFKVSAVAPGVANGKFFQAVYNSLFLGQSSQDAVCQNGAQNEATFYIRNGELFLYATKAAPQQIWVDRSSEGEGKIGYFRPGETIPHLAETSGFSVDSEGHLQFGNSDFIGCPGSANGPWTIFASAGTDQPGGYSDCIKFQADVIDDGHPLSCYYSEIDN